MRRLVLIALVCTFTSAARATAQSFTVVVNEANPVASLTKDELGRIFLKKMMRWHSGETIAPVDMTHGSVVREAFSKAIHGRSARAIQSHWQQQIFAGKDVPPPEKPRDSDVLEFVRTNPSAIGYVAAGTALGAGVRAVVIQQ